MNPCGSSGTVLSIYEIHTYKSNHLKPLGHEMIYFFNGGNIVKPWLVWHLYLVIVLHCVVENGLSHLPFQAPIHWRYLPYIRSICNAYVSGNIPTDPLSPRVQQGPKMDNFQALEVFSIFPA